MGNFGQRMEGRIRAFMVGRNGADNLSNAVLVVAIVLMGLQVATQSWVFTALCWIVLIYCIFRIVSRNVAARRAENQWWLERTAGIRGAWRVRKARKNGNANLSYFSCKKCGTVYTVPKGAGKVRATCPTCGEKYIHTV